MPDKKRLQRISDRIRQELSEMLIRDINDPRLDHIYIPTLKLIANWLLRIFIIQQLKAMSALMKSKKGLTMPMVFYAMH